MCYYIYHIDVCQYVFANLFSECSLNALAINNPLKYARLYLEGDMQIWVDAEDSLELW